MREPPPRGMNQGARSVALIHQYVGRSFTPCPGHEKTRRSGFRIIGLLRLLPAGEKVPPVRILPVQALFLLGRELPWVVGEHVEPPLLVEAKHPLALCVSSVVKPPDDVFRVVLHPFTWHSRGIPSFVHTSQY